MSAAVHSAKPVMAFIYDRHATLALGMLSDRLDRCQKYAADQGWSVAGEWVDRGDNALSDANRPQFDGMRAAMSLYTNTHTVICLVFEWDRITRDAIQSAVLRRKVQLSGGHCVTTEGETDVRKPSVRAY